MTNRWAVLALIMAAQTMANVGPLGIPSIAPLIRESLGLSVTQAGSFLSAYYIGPVLMSLLKEFETARPALLIDELSVQPALHRISTAPGTFDVTCATFGFRAEPAKGGTK